MVELLESPPVSPVRAVALVAQRDADGETAAVLSGAGVTVTRHQDAESAASGDAAGSSRVVVLAAGGRERKLSQAASTLAQAGRLVVALCERPGLADMRAMLQAGVRGVVLRREMTKTLIPTLIAVASGQVCLPREHSEAAKRPVLSMREKQVMRLVALGLMNSEIAARLYLAESTVKSHLSSAFAKLGVRSRHEAVELMTPSIHAR